MRVGWSSANDVTITRSTLEKELQLDDELPVPG
jgi:hypothetical protein